MDVNPASTKAARPGRLAYVDVMTVLSSFAVVVLHCNGCFFEGPVQGRSFVSAVFIETLLYWPVPVFFMISGTTLLRYRDRCDTRVYLRKRALKTLVPYVVWSLAGIPIAMALAGAGHGSAPDLSLTAVIDGVLNTRYNDTYWFFPPLFACYLSIPLFSLAVDRKRLLGMLVVAGVALVSAAPLVCRLLGIAWNGSFAPPPVTGYMLYVIAGFLISEHQFTKRQLWAAAALGMVGWLVSLLGTFAVSTPEAGLVDTYIGYLNLPIFLQAIGVFALARSLDFGHGVLRRLSAVCARLSPLTFGVYLLHMYLIQVAVALLPIDTHSIVWRTVGAFCIAAACLVTTWVLRKNPITKHIVP